jgi:hypothetical protein
MSELKIVPILEFEKLVLCEEDTAFRPTKENMTALKVCNVVVYILYFSILLHSLTLTFDITFFNATLFVSFYSSITCFCYTGPSSDNIAIVAKAVSL